MSSAWLPFVVDSWRVPPKGRPAHFLTHIHTDHTIGLHDRWDHGPIYCTPVTKALLLAKFALDADLVTALEVGEAHTVWLGDGRCMSVLVVDANHCPGACMFLFEGYFGSILSTGDFRFSRALHCGFLPLQQRLAARPLDKLYLDNTYCTPYFEFPPTADVTAIAKAVVLEQAEERQRQARETGGKAVVRCIVGLDSVGKEPLLMALAAVCQTRVGLTCKRMRTVRLAHPHLPDREVDGIFRLSSFSPKGARTGNARGQGEGEGEEIEGGREEEGGEGEAGRRGIVLEAVDRRLISRERLAAWNEAMPTFVLMPSVRSHMVLKPRNELIFTVPYSEHSCYSELLEFVAWLRPREIHPTVQQPYRQLKKYLLPSAPGALLGDFASYRSAEGVADRSGAGKAVKRSEGEELPGVPEKPTIDEYQAFYHRTFNLGKGNRIRPDLFRTASCSGSLTDEEEEERQASPLQRSSSSPCITSPASLSGTRSVPSLLLRAIQWQEGSPEPSREPVLPTRPAPVVAPIPPLPLSPPKSAPSSEGVPFSPKKSLSEVSPPLVREGGMRRKRCRYASPFRKVHRSVFLPSPSQQVAKHRQTPSKKRAFVTRPGSRIKSVFLPDP